MKAASLFPRARRRFGALFSGLSWITLSGRARMVASILAGLVAAGALAHLVVDRVTALPDDAVLRVGDVTVTKADFQQRVTVLTALYGVQPPQDGPGRDAFQRDAARAVALSVILDDVAAKQHLVVPDTQVQDALQKIIQDKFPNGQGAFDQALSAMHVTEPQILAEIKRQLTASRLYEQVTAGTPPVTDQDITNAYNQRRRQMVTPERRHLRNLVYNTQDQAQQALTELRGGADITTLATGSADKSTANTGGDLGVLSADQLEPPVASAAFTPPKGGFYGPVQSQHGWNVGQVVDIQPAQPLSLDQVKDQLRGQLQQEREMDRWRPWLAQQIRDGHAQYADAYRPADPNDLPPGSLG